MNLRSNRNLKTPKENANSIEKFDSKQKKLRLSPSPSVATEECAVLRVVAGDARILCGGVCAQQNILCDCVRRWCCEQLWFAGGVVLAATCYEIWSAFGGVTVGGAVVSEAHRLKCLFWCWFRLGGLTALKNSKSKRVRRKRRIYLHSHPMNTILRHRLRLSPIPILYYFPKSLFPQPSLLFSTTTSDPRTFTLSYLINTCGFSHEVALKLSKRLRFETAQKPDSIISFFQTHGFSVSQIYRIFSQAPDLMICDPTKRLLPKFQFLASKGATPSDTVLTVSKSPRFLRYSLNNHIIPIFELIRTFLPSDLRALAVLIACPNFIGDSRVASNVQMLLDAGVTHSGIRYLLCSRPSVLCSDLRNVVEEVKLLGFDPLKLSFALALLAKRAVSKPLWDAKVEALKKWGWSEDDIFVAFKNQPNLMLRSKEKLNAVMEFWVGRLGWDHSTLIASPTLFSYSLEKRVVPRALVVQYLLSKGLVKKGASLVTPFGMSDEMFLRKYVKRYKEETPRLLELYQEGQGTC
ncbi:hypothetical protein VNO80_22779 [Phaseolus coccineus]|uniref:Uncharacterized protein n=1 Tax=Phaseolus coccineus TaxID=3886 RepID=A0AAN9QUL3_PHACN